MIFGTVSYSPIGSASVFEGAVEALSNGGLLQKQVHAEGFDGGFFLNPHLPFGPSDCLFTDKGRDILLLMCGSLYNGASIRREEKLNQEVPDPEMAAELFLRQGPDFVKQLNGDFAILVMQPGKRETYLFRDHLGIMPLAWSAEGDSLHFSTDIILLSILRSGGRGARQEYLTGTFRFADYNKTPCEDVSKLPPGHWLRFDKKGYELKRYWEPERIQSAKSMKYDTMMTDLGELLRDSVMIRCDGRFTAGAHVSSGLDSGILAVLARKGYQSQEVFHGFSLSPQEYEPEEVRYDERDRVKKLCSENEITPVFSCLTSEDMLRYTDEFRYNQGYFTDEEILDRVRSRTVNLIFSGWGGDEFISTGSRTIEADLFYGLKWRIFFRRHPVTRPRRLLRVLFYGILLPTLRIKGRTISASLAEDAKYLRKGYRQSNSGAVKAFFLQSSRRSHHLGMLRSYHLQERCEAWYNAGWRKGVVYRYPLLDRRIVEYMLKVPSELLCVTDEPRPLLRALGKGLLTEEIRANRSKEDPVFGEFIGNVFEETGRCLVGEIDEWKENPDLRFIDFGLVEKDVARYASEAESVDGVNLYRAIVRIRSLHRFTLQFREGYTGETLNKVEAPTEDYLKEQTQNEKRN
jgi:asparagine synthase (glutamine-hydrolysing)